MSTSTYDDAFTGGGGKAPPGSEAAEAGVAAGDCAAAGEAVRISSGTSVARSAAQRRSSMWTATAKAVDYRLRTAAPATTRRIALRGAMDRTLLNATLAFAATLLASACATSPVEEEHAALVAAERAFAKHADDADIRTAFRAAFAPDAVWMVPSPMRLEEAYAARPAPADPRAARLQWDPAISGIAASGDFGFTSGPSVFSLRDQSRPPGYGAYVSIWKRDAQRWRVALDAGIPSPTPIPPEALQPSLRVLPARGGNARDPSPPLALERAQPWSLDALVAALAGDARYYRE